MIKLVTDRKRILEICEKLRDMKERSITEASLFRFIHFSPQNCCYASFEKEKMTGCTVLYLGRDIKGELALFVIFQWIDPHYPGLWNEYVKFIDQQAKAETAKKISFTTSRNEDAVIRKLGQYGYRKTYTIIEKEVI